MSKVYSSSIEILISRSITKGHTMDHIIQTTAACQPRQPVNVIARVFAALEITRQRRQLRELDDHQLRDMGITRAQAAREASKPPWDAPQSWKHSDK
jgi:uncharacterized protein YjiS (DUF1127 family)